MVVAGTIRHHRILEKLGGLGVLYKAQGIELGRFVALIFLSENSLRDAQTPKRFQREARTAQYRVARLPRDCKVGLRTGQRGAYFCGQGCESWLNLK